MTRPHRLPTLFVLTLALGPLGCGGTPTTPAPAGTQAAAPAGPKADFGTATTLDAGEVDYARSRDFVFLVRNAGGAPLELKLAKKSCGCAEVEMPAGPVAPGAEGKVVVHWAPPPGSSGHYDLTLNVETNDPQAAAVPLVVRATIKPLVRVFIEGKEDNAFVDFGDAPIPPGGSRVREVKVFSTELPSFALNATAGLPGLKVSKAPLPAGTRLGSYVARSGYAVELRTTDELSLGYVRTALNLALSQLGGEPDRTISVPVYAVVGAGALTVTPAALAFTKRHITDADTARVNLEFVVPPEEDSVAVTGYEPKFLKVDPPEKLAPGRWRVTAHLPAGNAEAARYQPDAFMEGQVVLKVAGQQRPVTVRVKWVPAEE